MSEREELQHLIARLPSDQRGKANEFASSLREAIFNAGLVASMYAMRLVIAEMEEVFNRPEEKCDQSKANS